MINRGPGSEASAEHRKCNRTSWLRGTLHVALTIRETHKWLFHTFIIFYLQPIYTIYHNSFTLVLK